MDVLGLSALSPRTLRELPRASLLTKPQNHDLSHANSNYFKEIATPHHQNADKTQGGQNRDFNFTKDVSTLNCKRHDKTQGGQNIYFNFTKEISTSHCRKRDNTQDVHEKLTFT